MGVGTVCEECHDGLVMSGRGTGALALDYMPAICSPCWDTLGLL